MSLRQLIFNGACHRLTDDPLVDNVDYDDIKQFIKRNTTAGGGKAVAVPGRESDKFVDLEQDLLAILNDQHERISVFVRSKAGEVQRRLGMPSHIYNTSSSRSVSHRRRERRARSRANHKQITRRSNAVSSLRDKSPPRTNEYQYDVSSASVDSKTMCSKLAKS